MTVNESGARWIPTIGVALLAGWVLAACNTVEGAGEDIEGAGDAISDTARDAKKELKE